MDKLYIASDKLFAGQLRFLIVDPNVIKAGTSENVSTEILSLPCLSTAR